MSEPIACCIPLTDPQDWNALIPKDRAIWIVTDEGDVFEVQYHDEAHVHGFEVFARTDGESGSWWEPSEITAWSDSREGAEEVARLLMEHAHD